MASWIGITAGDPTGIGPEVLIKALARELPATPAIRYLVIGDRAVLDHYNRGPGLPLAPFCGYEVPVGRVWVLEPHSVPLPSGLCAGAAPAAEAALEWLREGALRASRGELAALVTAPVNKQAIVRAGHAFVGQTEFLSGLAGTAQTAMMLLGHDDRGRWLRVVLATTHLPLRHVADALTTARVRLAIERAAGACADLGLPRRRVGVCGLNPHAGEGGVLGTEELEVIQPAIDQARALGLDVAGPLPADSAFHQAFQGRYDVLVAMYHDQGLAPLKLIGFDTGVNWTLGLPFVRTSPDHGTAYDLAGRGQADPTSMQEALRLARQLVATRAGRRLS